ncbi:MAG: ribosome maturation factor RimP [Acidimicrobiia bacterium]|nr:ribosome maturation factor RimP [Acidimicrobiia bacterium]
MTDRTDAIRDELEPVVVALGCSLYDVLFVGVGTGSTLQVLVDCPGGVDLDTIEKMTQRVSGVLDGMQPELGAYTLEVSSPGLERSLRIPSHFVAALGSTVSIKVRNEAGRVERLRGEMVSADADKISLVLDGVERVFLINEVVSARTVFEWQATPKPGKGSKPGSKKETAAVSGGERS